MGALDLEIYNQNREIYKIAPILPRMIKHGYFHCPAGMIEMGELQTELFGPHNPRIEIAPLPGLKRIQKV